MGAIAPSKMPKKKVIHRTDDPNDVELYAKGGRIHHGPIQVSKVPGSMNNIVKKMLKNPGKLTASDMFAKGGSAQQAAIAIAMKEKGVKPKGMAGGGLYANIAAKKKRIADGSGEKMRSVGSKGAPKKSDFANAAKTASYAEGGKSTVNAAGNYTKPELRKRIFNNVKAAAIVGTGAGQWSARKAQVMAKRYKAAGGGYK